MDQEERRWGWMAAAVGVGALATAIACGFDAAWVAGGLFAAIGFGMLLVARIRLRRGR